MEALKDAHAVACAETLSHPVTNCALMASFPHSPTSIHKTFCQLIGKKQALNACVSHSI